MKRSIVNDGQDCGANHRQDFETCPTCNAVFKVTTWSDRAQILVLNPRCERAGYAAVMAACSKCHELSWVHVQLSGHWEYSHKNWPKAWHKVAAELEEATRLSAARNFAFSLCGRCKNLEEARVEYAASRTCTVGMGPVVLECDKFIELKWGENA